MEKSSRPLQLLFANTSFVYYLRNSHEVHSEVLCPIIFLQTMQFKSAYWMIKPDVVKTPCDKTKDRSCDGMSMQEQTRQGLHR